MILFLGDLHGRFAAVNRQIAHAEGRFGEKSAAVVVLGDFGLFADALREWFDRDGNAFVRPVYFVEGNHEDFARLAELVERYAGQFTHLPRGSLRSVAGRRLLCLGGAGYLDRHLTPPAAVISDDDINRALAHPADAVDIIVSHDCPRGLAVSSAPGFAAYGPAGFPRGEELAARYRPRFWVFGHHHQWYAAQPDDTAYYGLAESWEGYGILQHDRFTVVEHKLPRAGREPWYARLRSLLAGPDPEPGG